MHTQDNELLNKKIELLEHEITRIAHEKNFQSLLIEISSMFISLELSNAAEVINKALQKIGTYVNADRCYIFDYNWEKGTSKNTFEWCAEGINPEMENLQALPLEYLSYWVDAHKNNELLCVEDVDALPEQDPLRQILEPQGIKRLLTIPIANTQECYGFVGFDYVRKTQLYTYVEKDLLSLFAQMLLNLKQKQSYAQKLSIQEEKYRNIINNMNLGLLEVDKNDVIVFANFSFCKMSGYRYEELLGKNASQLFLQKEEIEKMKTKAKERSQGASDSYEIQVTNKTGEKRWWFVSGAPNYNDKLEFIGSIGIHFDITEKKRLEEEQEQLNTITTRQNERLKNFAHIVSHNLRSHAANLKLLGEELVETNPELRDMELAQMIKQVSSNLLDAIGHLSEVATLNVTENLKTEQINLRYVAQNVFLSINELAKRSNVQLINEINPSHNVLAMPAYLESIILNFVTNSIKYASSERDAFVRLSSYEDQHFVVLDVEDNGLGIDLEKFGTKLFGLYKTFHKNEDAKGVGLYITKNQVEAMGGKIAVESQPGKGSCFSVHFPKAQ
ncbi:MAG: PAS domain S-box protein [Flavobacteriales bacterium]